VFTAWGIERFGVRLLTGRAAVLGDCFG
jgi:hypothetical protein